MPWETVGSTSTGEMPGDEEWIVFSLELAKRYVEFVCGSPPEGCELGVAWHDHELGAYPTLGVWYECSQPDAYSAACQSALETFDEAVDWNPLRRHWEDRLDELSCKEGEDDDD